MKQAHCIYQNDDHRWLAIARDATKPGYIDRHQRIRGDDGEQAAVTRAAWRSSLAVFGPVGRGDPTTLAGIFAPTATRTSSRPWPCGWSSSPTCSYNELAVGVLPAPLRWQEPPRADPRSGMTIRLGGLELQAIPAHYLHSSGNHHLYDPEGQDPVLRRRRRGPAAARSGRPVRGGLLPPHPPRRGPSTSAGWAPTGPSATGASGSRLEIDMLVPQHGGHLPGRRRAALHQLVRGAGSRRAARLKLGPCARRACHAGLPPRRNRVREATHVPGSRAFPHHLRRAERRGLCLYVAPGRWPARRWLGAPDPCCPTWSIRACCCRRSPWPGWRAVPFVHGWLTAKIVGLLAYIGLGMSGPGRAAPWPCGAALRAARLATFSWIVSVALSKNPMVGWLAGPRRRLAARAQAWWLSRRLRPRVSRMRMCFCCTATRPSSWKREKARDTVLSFSPR